MDLRARRAFAAMAALGLTYTVVSHSPLIAVASGPSAQAANDLAAQINGAHELRYGQRVTVSGRLPDGRSGVPLALEYQPSASAPWSELSSATSAGGGAYRLSAPVSRSGALRVAETDQAAAARAAGTRGSVAVAAPAATGAASAPMPLSVRAGMGLHRRQLDVLDGHAASVTGTVAPAVAGRTVVLQVQAGHTWRTVARTRTGTRGRYRLGITARQTGSHPARVRFAGDAANAATARSVGRLNVYRLAAASWYGGGGTTACGQSLDSGTLGVANKTLPCGTMVTLRYGGRTVRVPVIDRGPYVAGREFDLTQATKDALGFGDTGEVWTTA
jgi:hypothetical protein